MTTYVALLRAVNVAGRNRVGMSDLRQMLTGMGFEDLRTLLQSGNAVFKGPRQSPAALEKWLEAESSKQLDLDADFCVRTAAEWAGIVKANPFAAEADRDPGHLVVMCLKSAPTTAAVGALESSIVGRERIQAVASELFIVYPDGIGRSKLTNALIEKRLGTRGTGRNWNTALKLADECAR